MEKRMTNKKSCSFDVSAGTSTNSLELCDLSTATISSRGRVRLPRLKYWNGERASLFEDTLLYQVSSRAVPKKVVCADNSQTAPELSCFESSDSINDINCNFCVVNDEDESSSGLKNSKTKMKNTVAEKTRKNVARKRVRTIYDSPKNSSRDFCNSSSDKQNVNVSKINKMNEKENTFPQTSQRKPVVFLEEFSFDDIIGKKKIKSSRKKSSFKTVNGDNISKNIINNLKTKYKDVIKDVSVCVTPLSNNKKQNRSKASPCSAGNRFTKNVSLKKPVDGVAINKGLKNSANATRYSKVQKVSKKNLEPNLSPKKRKTVKEAKNKTIRNKILKKSPETKSSSSDTLNVTFSSKGRARLPRLEYWRGERISTIEDFTIYESKVLAKPQKIDNFNCSVVLERNVDDVKNNVAQKNRISKVNPDREKINAKLSDSSRKRNVDLENMAWKSRYKKKTKKKNNKPKCQASPKRFLFENPEPSRHDPSLPTKKRKLFSQTDVDIDLNDGSDSAALHSCLTERSESRAETSTVNEMSSVPSSNEKLKEKWINEILQKISPSTSSQQEDAKRKPQPFSKVPFSDRTSLWVKSNFSETQLSTFSNSVDESVNDCQKKSSTDNKKDNDSKLTTADECAMEIDRKMPSDELNADEQEVVGEKTAPQSDGETITFNVCSSDSETSSASSDELCLHDVASVRKNNRQCDCSGRVKLRFRYIDDCESDFVSLS